MRCELPLGTTIAFSPSPAPHPLAAMALPTFEFSTTADDAATALASEIAGKNGVNPGSDCSNH
jgi:hypothetical protein